jgi:hypothetical protein
MLSRCFIAFALVIVVCTSAFAMQRIPPEVKQVVAFVLVQTPDGKLVPNGTGFFIGVHDDQDSNRHWVYIVTARHVLCDAITGKLLQKVYLRLDKKAGGTESVEVPIVPDGPNRTVYFHVDPTVDLAVIPFLPDQNAIDFKYLPDELITDTAKFNELKISEGDEVFFTGLFIPHLGQEKNYPIVRFGRVALITSEKVHWQDKGKDTLMELYLLEVSSYGGNSGSPVFFYFGPDREPGQIRIGPSQIFLAGIMMGYFGENRPIQFAQTAVTPYSTSNNGIAAVVPAYKLREMLYSDELNTQRHPQPK